MTDNPDTETQVVYVDVEPVTTPEDDVEAGKKTQEEADKINEDKKVD
jgi:hypothetical protein